MESRFALEYGITFQIVKLA